ncbi:palmitoyltransferase swf1, partial [Coelomomyces lativittatus]
RILGPTCVKLLLRVINWVGFERNPLVQIFFLSLLTGGIYVFYLFGWSRIPTDLVHEYHRIPIIISILQAYFSFMLASASDPGKISLENSADYLGYYPMDNLIFSPTICKTCHIIKPARSKHCSMCKGCIMRLDHHCVWINNCVGHKNIHYFIYFLASILWICAYGAYLCLLLSIPNLNFSLLHIHGIQSFMSWAFSTEPILISLCLFISVADILVLIFLIHFFYLNVWSGMTTNESCKWDDLEWMLKHKQLYLGKKGQKLYLSMKPCEEPKSYKDLINIYDEGILKNFKQILWPLPLPIKAKYPLIPMDMPTENRKFNGALHSDKENSSLTLKKKSKKKQKAKGL